MAETTRGTCFCGSVEFEVTGDAALQGYCHCEDCRQWSGAPVTAYALWPSDAVRITAGADKVVAYSKTGLTHRKHCRDCGGAVMTVVSAMGMTDVYPVLLNGFRFQPKTHIYYALRRFDMPDGLPKFKDFPADFGGSGDMVPE